jgi:4-alpha-glucanotransferase
MNLCLDKKIAGVMIPLFSIRTQQNFGNGEILDLLPFIDFMANTHLSLLQLLPINEVAKGETSPYNALTAFAFDPIYISLHACIDFRESNAAQVAVAQSNLTQWQSSPHVCWEEIRAFKFRVFDIIYEHFKENVGSHRAELFQIFMETQAEWLEEYALFRLIYEQHGGFINWPDPFKNRNAAALSNLKEGARDRLLFFKYLQWIAWEQWQEVKARAQSKNIFIMGDIPFLVSRESADVWSHPDLFPEGDLVGAPPDDFTEEGQFWGLPMFSFPKMEETHFQWWRQKIRFTRELYHLIRLDHVVGFFRTWVFPKEGKPYFEPGDMASQKERGKLFLEVFLEEAGEAMLVAEDLGVIPPFVNETLYNLHIPGMKIMRWQKRKDRYLHPKLYPWLSVATTGTHDTTPMALWWNEISVAERDAFLSMLNKGNVLSPETPSIPPDDPAGQLIWLSALASASSMIAILPFQDILGLSDEINQPGTISEKNWCYRMPENIDSLCDHPLWKNKLDFLKTAIVQYDRAGKPSLVRLCGL